MKNVHILPTDKPSRLAGSEYITNEQGIDKRVFKFKLWDKLIPNNDLKDIGYIPQNIYITSDEEIKEGDWCLSKLNEAVRFGKKFTTSLYKKIILTTDPDLIKDGVQSIDNEFLEWFVKNPNCEVVKVEEVKCTGQCWKFIESDYEDTCLSGCEQIEYKIIIPQEEPKQEYELKDFESGGILDVLNMGNVEYLGNGDIIYNPNLFFIKRDNKWFIKTKEPKQDLEKEIFESEQELDIPSHLRWHNSKPKQETLEDSIYQAIGLAANEQGIINQALATSKVMDVLKKTNL
jgi:hypothetical protein